MSGSPNIQRIKFKISVLIFQLGEMRKEIFGNEIIPLKLYFLVLETRGQLYYDKSNHTLSMIFPPQFSIHECLDSLPAGRALEIFDGT